MNKITLMGIKTFASPDGGGFNATLVINGKKAAMVHDGGYGGEVEVHPIQNGMDLNAVYQILNEEAAKLPPFKYTDGSEIAQDAGCLISGLVTEWETKKEEKRLQKLCQTKVLFQVKGDPKDRFRVIVAKWDDKMKSFLTTKYGDKLENVLNEKYA